MKNTLNGKSGGKPHALQTLRVVLCAAALGGYSCFADSPPPIRIGADQFVRTGNVTDINTGSGPQWVRGDDLEFDLAILTNGTVMPNWTNIETVTLSLFAVQNDTNLPLMSQTLTNFNAACTNFCDGTKSALNTNLSQAAWTNNVGFGPAQGDGNSYLTNFQARFLFPSAQTAITLNGQASQSYWMRLYVTSTNSPTPRIVTCLEGYVTVIDGPFVTGPVQPIVDSVVTDGTGKLASPTNFFEVNSNLVNQSVAPTWDDWRYDTMRYDFYSAPPTLAQTFLASTNVGQSNLWGHIQGYTWDGTNHYASFTGALMKYSNNAVWSNSTAAMLIQSNLNPLASLTGANHLGDLKYYNGQIYVAAENYTSETVYGSQQIGVFNATTLAFVASYPMTDLGLEASALAICTNYGTNGTIWVASFGTPVANPCAQQLRVYDLGTFAFLRSVPLSEPIGTMQGITWSPLYGRFFVTGNSGSPDILSVTPSGNVQSVGEDTIGVGMFTTEGMDIVGNTLRISGFNTTGGQLVLFDQLSFSDVVQGPNFSIGGITYNNRTGKTVASTNYAENWHQDFTDVEGNTDTTTIWAGRNATGTSGSDLTFGRFGKDVNSFNLEQNVWFSGGWTADNTNKYSQVIMLRADSGAVRIRTKAPNWDGGDQVISAWDYDKNLLDASGNSDWVLATSFNGDASNYLASLTGYGTSGYVLTSGSGPTMSWQAGGGGGGWTPTFNPGQMDTNSASQVEIKVGALVTNLNAFGPSGSPAAITLSGGGSSTWLVMTNTSADKIFYNVGGNGQAGLLYDFAGNLYFDEVVASNTWNFQDLNGNNILTLTNLNDSASFAGDIWGASNLTVAGSISGNLNASQITSGTVPTGNLGSGTANAGSALYGDQTYKVTTNATPGTNIVIAAGAVSVSAGVLTNGDVNGRSLNGSLSVAGAYTNGNRVFTAQTNGWIWYEPANAFATGFPQCGEYKDVRTVAGTATTDIFTNLWNTYHSGLSRIDVYIEAVTPTNTTWGYTQAHKQLWANGVTNGTPSVGHNADPFTAVTAMGTPAANPAAITGGWKIQFVFPSANTNVTVTHDIIFQETGQ